MTTRPLRASPASFSASCAASGLASLFLTFSCGQSASFHDATGTVAHRTGDDAVAADAPGSAGGPADPGATGGPGQADSHDADDTTGDHEPGDEAGHVDSADTNDTDDTNGNEGGSAGGGTASGGDQDDLPGNDSTSPRKKLTRETSFPSHVLAHADAEQSLDQAYLTQSLKLQRQYSDRAKQLKQIVRPVMTDNFEQGHSGAAGSETFDQVANRLLDILVVVDNSGSMEEEQNNLASKLLPLLSYVGGTDWRIGVVTTDPNQSCLRALIRKGDENAAQAFANAVTAGTAGSNNERAILQAVRSLSATCLTQPWIRSESTLATLIVSDEDNCSDGDDCPGKDYAKASYLYNYLASIREPGRNARVYGIIWHPSQTQAQCPTALNKANLYAELIAATSGTWGSICDSDYSATLSEISQNILVTLNTRFTLHQQPDPGSVRVFLDQTELMTGFTVRGKVVEILPPPAAGVKVKINYAYGSTPMQTAFTLRYKPVVDGMSVTVNGQPAAAGSYSVDAAAQVVRFATAPAGRALIAVGYARDIALTKQYLLVDSIRPGSLRVWIDAAPTSGYAVTEAIGLVIFNDPPAEGATIDFAYQVVGAPVLAYPFATVGVPSDLVAYDATSGLPVRVAYAAGAVAVNQDDWWEGRVVALRYDNLARQRFQIMLPNAPLVDSVVATGGGATCTGAPRVAVNGATVAVDGCGFGDDVTTVRVGYDFVVEAKAEFIFDASRLPAANEWQEWHVWVDGAERSDYVRSGNVIRFAAALPARSIVKIRLIQEDK